MILNNTKPCINMNRSTSLLTRKNEYETIQVTRFICALVVMILHTAFYTSERLDSKTFHYDQGFQGVKLFFIISGFVMIISSESLMGNQKAWSIFAIKRIIRIVPIYWIMTTYKLIILIFASSLIYHARLDYGFILKSYFFIPAFNVDGSLEPFYGVGWTLNYEMFFYLLFTVALLVRVRPIVFMSIILIPLSVLSIYRTSNWPAAVSFYANPIILNFLYGMIAGQLIINGKKLSQRLAIPLIVICLLYIFIPRIGIISGIPSNNVIVSIASFLLIYGAASIENFWGKKIPAQLIYLGGASYSLYLIHPSVAPLAPTLLNLLHLKFDVLSVVLGVLGAILVGTTFYKFCEKPLTKFLSNCARKFNLI